jgi:L-ascorbate metabolism protein UlaG (beta-lactamase superfamily)
MPEIVPVERLSGDRLTFLGHSTVLIEMADARMLTDPVLGHVMWSLRRRTARASDDLLADLDVVFISHGHFDHLDLPSLRSLPGRPDVIVPVGLGRVVERAGLGHVHEVRAGDRLSIAGLELEAVAAAHDGRRWPWVQASESLGCLVSRVSSVYFAGDTDLFAAMADLAGRVDVALLPVGGWGPRLGRGHLDPRRAAEAAALIRPACAVPIHWGTLSVVGLHRLLGDRFGAPGPAFAEAVAQTAPDVRVRVLGPGDSFLLPSPPSRAGD